MADLRAATPSAAAEIVAEDSLVIMRQLIEMGHRLENLMGRAILKRRDQVSDLEKRVKRFNALEKINDRRIQVDRSEERINRAMMAKLSADRQLISHYQSRIEAMNPFNLLKKGYVLVKDEEGQAIKSLDLLKIDQRLELRFKDGLAKVSVLSKEEDSNGSKKTKNKN